MNIIIQNVIKEIYYAGLGCILNCLLPYICGKIYKDIHQIKYKSLAINALLKQ